MKSKPTVFPTRYQRAHALRAAIAGTLLAIAALLPGHAAVHFQTLKSFGFPEFMGTGPEAPVIQGSDGLLYGVTREGGTRNAGTVFKLRKDGTGYAVLHHFNYSDGAAPQAGLLEGSDHELYGTTWIGGSNYSGVVFKLNKDGSNYRLLHKFGAGSGDGSQPHAFLIEAHDGALYGTTSGGGNFSAGTVFKLNRDGSGYAIEHHFGDPTDAGQQPQAGLLEGTDGNLYGTTTYGGTNHAGTIFKLHKDGSGYSNLFSFAETGIFTYPNSALIQGTDGALYGTTGGGSNNLGTIFKLNPDDSSFSVLHVFSFGDAQYPYAGLLKGSDGALYGAAVGGGVNGGGTVFKLNPYGTDYTVLHSFGFSPGEGVQPYAALIEGSEGALYGTTVFGGVADPNGSSYGTMYRLNKDGNGYAVLNRFSNTGGDGRTPTPGLVIGSDGALYGTTSGGGADSGTVFKLNPDGSGYRPLFNFDSPSRYDLSPSPLLAANDGALYGTTTYGGDTSANFHGYGTVFKINRDGTGYQVLHAFSSFEPGKNPRAPLIQGSDGALYGTTYYGGGNGGGTVFKLNTDGNGYSVLRSFYYLDGGPQNPETKLLEGRDGALYGTTFSGGTNLYYGAIFRLNKDGTDYRLLHSFTTNQVNGQFPAGELVEANDGALCGITSGGGSNLNYGAVFTLTKDGTGYRILHSFSSNPAEGSAPQSALVPGSDGAFYGTTQNGGSHNLGTLFRLNADGSGFAIVYNFGAIDSESSPQAGLIQGKDGAFYGTTLNGGYGFGTVFKLWPPQTPDILTLARGTNAVQMAFAGVSGYRYQVLRSVDLVHWSALTNISMPPLGIYTNFDRTPPGAQAYYRAAWLP